MGICENGDIDIIGGHLCVCRDGKWVPHDAQVDRRSIRALDADVRGLDVDEDSDVDQ